MDGGREGRDDPPTSLNPPIVKVNENFPKMITLAALGDVSRHKN